ncbi:MAG: tetratricopeptide repeat protein [Bacteroidales bacterium]|nr:tetratricopeptide repeat protein [Bacteroidales bacterium]
MKIKILSSILGLILSVSAFGAQTEVNGNFQEKLASFETQGGKYGIDSVKCITELSLYQEAFKQWKKSNYKSAIVNEFIPHWRWVFLNCPIASENTYVNGLKIMSYYLKKATNDEEKNAYLDTLMMIHEARIKYFPNHYKTGKSQIGSLKGKMGIDLFMLAPERCEKAYNILKESVEMEGSKSSTAALVYYFRATIKMVKSGKADEELIIDTYDKISSLVDQNLIKYKDKAKYLSQWENVKGNINNTFEPYATCDVLVKIYSKKFEANPSDIVLLNKITKILKKKKCTKSDLFFNSTEALYNAEPTPESAMLMGKMNIEKEAYKDAAKYYLNAVDMIEDPLEKADIYSDLGKIYYKLNDYITARSYARKAIALNPADGMSYILIGDLYAASASKCGTNELTKKVAYWAAVDKYYQAKRVDAELTELANKRIATYSKHFPQMDVIFFHDLQEGASFKVECWINETTTVRAAK